MRRRSSVLSDWVFEVKLLLLFFRMVSSAGHALLLFQVARRDAADPSIVNR